MSYDIVFLNSYLIVFFNRSKFVRAIVATCLLSKVCKEEKLLESDFNHKEDKEEPQGGPTGPDGAAALAEEPKVEEPGLPTDA